MPTEFVLPELGENIEAGDVVNILVSVGDTINIDDPILELETDKATLEVPSSVSGVIKAIHVKDGETVRVGQVILTAEDGTGETTTSEPGTEAPLSTPEAKLLPDPAPIKVPEVEPKPEPEISTPVPAPPPMAPAPTPAPAPATFKPRPEPSMVPAAPMVRRLAREIGVNITHVAGTGPAGRISINDIKRHAREMRFTGAAPATARPTVPLPDFSKWGEVERRPMNNVRRATAEHMDRAWSTIPHVTQFDKADVTELEQLRRRFGQKVEQAGGKLTITAILLKVAAAALKEFSQFNASLNLAQQEIVYKHYYHIGVAVDTDRGLLVPVIRDVDQKNIMELAVELGEVAQKARDRKLALEDMQGGTFTITNLGGIGGTNFTPIVNAPEVAILGVARGRKEPVFNADGQFEPRLMLPLSLSYDHRLIDGADGARFLRWIVEYLEQPFLTALQGW
jgi:pyruvate dehydrogenase E2 component (dihydrolipoamide acetyltransferase)